MFLSHSSKDQRFARELSDRLMRLGVDVWLDEWELDLADELHPDIGDAVARSRIVGVVISPAFLESEWCRRELRLAMAKERKERDRVIVPILHRQATLPPGLRNRKHVDFRSGSYYASLAELGGLFHELGAQRLRERIRQNRPRSLAAVATIFVELGWDGFELLDSRGFDVLARLKGVEGKGNRLEYFPADVGKLNRSLSPRAKWILRYA